MNWNLLSKYRNQTFGVSIISIMIFHFFEDVAKYGTGVFYPLAKVYNYLFASIGVELFVFLSGMGLYFSFVRNKNLKSYFSKRLKRIMPTYLIWGLLFWAVRDFVILKEQIKIFLYDYSLLSFWREGTKCLWFIAFILLMYFIFPVLYRYFDVHGLGRELRLFLLLAGLAGCIMVLKRTNIEVYKNIEIALYRVYIFILGVYLAKYVFEKKKCGIGSWLLVIGGIVIKAYDVLCRVHFGKSYINQRIVMCFYAIGLLFIIAKILDVIHWDKLNRILKIVGMYSLELYVTHVTIRHLMNAVDIRTYYLKNYIICIGISIIMSILLRKIVESNYLNRILGRMTKRIVCDRIN